MSFRNEMEMSGSELENNKALEESVESGLPHKDDSPDGIKPKQQIGLLGAVTFATGCMIGSGIFVSPTSALKSVGSIGMSLVVWLISGMISMVFGLVYGELGTIIPHSGGDYTYIYKGLGSGPAFLAVWIQTLINNTSSFPILALVFADYLLTPIFGNCGAPDSIRKTIAAVVILTLAITNVISVKVAANTQIIFTFAKVVALTIISIGGIVYMGQGNLENIRRGFTGSSTNVVDYTLAFYKCMFAYHGYSRTNEIAEELINSKRNIPRAVLFSILFVTVIYVTTNLSYSAALSNVEIVSSPAVAYDWALIVIKPASIIIPLSVMCSTYGALNGGGFSTGRIMFAAARNGHFPEVMSYLHVRTTIPVLSVIGTHVIGLILLIPGDIGTLINFASFSNFIVVGLTCISLLRIRYNMKETNTNSFRTPISVIVLSFLICVFMIVSPFLDSPKTELLYGLAFIGVGVLVYFVFVFFDKSIPGFDKVTTFLQLVVQVSPTAKLD